MPGLLEARAAHAKPPKAKAVIMLFLLGAPPQVSWDLKPDAPAEIRNTLGQPLPITRSQAVKAVV